MMNNMFGYDWGAGMGSWAPYLPILLLWSLFWKGLALWHAGKRNQPWWFVIILVVNTAGILEIIYLFLVLKMKAQDLFKKE
jgi:hypothetical protein